MFTTVYHIKDGAKTLYDIDARHALTFSDEWSREPWPVGDARKRKTKPADGKPDGGSKAVDGDAGGDATQDDGADA